MLTTYLLLLNYLKSSVLSVFDYFSMFLLTSIAIVHCFMSKFVPNTCINNYLLISSLKGKQSYHLSLGRRVDPVFFGVKFPSDGQKVFKSIKKNILR